MSLGHAQPDQLSEEVIDFPPCLLARREQSAEFFSTRGQPLRGQATARFVFSSELRNVRADVPPILSAVRLIQYGKECTRSRDSRSGRRRTGAAGPGPGPRAAQYAGRR